MQKITLIKTFKFVFFCGIFFILKKNVLPKIFPNTGRGLIRPSTPNKSKGGKIGVTESATFSHLRKVQKGGKRWEMA